ncbi:MAG TPA: PfkB family carbohydrate kinase [Hansschlegelia sp.]
MSNAKIFIVGSFVVACTVAVDALPQPGESLEAKAFLLEAGGKGLNLAIAARRLGASVDGLFAIGDDMLSGLASSAFQRADLPVSMLRHKAGPTGGGVGFIAPNGETCLAVAPGANGALCAADVHTASAAIAAAHSCLAQFEVADEPIAEAFAIARRAGRLTVLNPSPFRRPSDAVLALTSVLCVNTPEAEGLARALFGGRASTVSDGFRELAAAVFALGPEALVITSGRSGATVWRRDAEPHFQPAFLIDAVDTLGAGDAFAAGVAVGLAEGRAWPEVMRLAAACGALTAARAGTFDALPAREAVDAMLSRAATA